LVKRKLIQVLSACIYNANLPGFLTGRIYQGPVKAFCVPGLNCYSCPGAIGACPIGALQSSLSGVILRIPFYVIGLMLLFAALLGRVVCGWLCPFGLLQELIYKLPTKKIPKSRFTAQLSKLKYIILFLVILAPIALYTVTGIGEPVFCEYFCPVGTFEGAIPLLSVNEGLRQAAGLLTAWKFLIMALFLIAMAFIFRPFCRFFCPLGAFYSFFNRMAIFGIIVDSEKCVHCGACAKTCKADIQLAGDRECVACGDCIDSCPVQAISIKNYKQREVKS
jgi:polyferredoxin